MLRYIERSGLVDARRAPASGYRLYGAAELQRLRTLRELLARFDLGLADVVFALRLRRERSSATRSTRGSKPSRSRPEDVAAADWLRWEQDKHQKLLNTQPMEISRTHDRR